VIARLRDAQDHPLVRRRFPPDVVDLLEHRWADQVKHLDVIDRLPATFCHGDAFRRNLFARATADGHCQTIAIDWAVVGIGWIGQDIKILIGNDMALRNVSPADARERDRMAFAGYLDGLRDAGWQGDPRDVRLGQILTVVGGPRAAGMVLELYLDESQHAWFEQSLGSTVTELADWGAKLTRHPPQDHWLGWGKEARQLLGEL